MAIVPILSDASSKRQQIRTKALLGINNLFPIEANNYSINVSNLEVSTKEYSINDIKHAILKGNSLTEPVHGTIILRNKQGKTVDKVSKFKLMSLPYFTDQHTFVIDGNSYSVGNQLRTKPGIYTRVRANQVLESSFNLAKGANFRISMDPETSKFTMEVGTTKVALWPVLSALGVKSADVIRSWGEEIAGANMGMTSVKRDQNISKLYTILVPKRLQSAEHTTSEKTIALINYFSGTQVDTETTKKTLGTPVDMVTGHAMLLAATKLLNVHRQQADVDDRDSLEFQKLHSVDDFVKERLNKAGKELVNKLIFKLNSVKDISDVKRVIPSSIFSPTVKSLITQFNLSRTPDQINPVEILDGAMKITRLGEGGISSTRAIPEVTRYLHPTHLGILDPVRTPESSTAGIDVRATMTTAKDDDGNIYAQLYDAKNKKLDFVPVNKISKSIIAFPGQKLKGDVDVIKSGSVTRERASKVDYVVPDTQTMLSPATSLLPFMESMQGNRALMGAKMMTQALPLKYREAPLVQVKSPFGGKSMHEEFGNMITRKSPIDGKVSKITSEYIYIKDRSGESHKVPYNNNFPYNSKTYIHDDIQVKVGDSVSEGQLLTTNNFTDKDGTLALGRNMRVAYMPYLGYNSNDAIVISDKASRDMTSMHMYKKVLNLDKETIVDRRKWVAQFPNKFTMEQLDQIDSSGVAKKGTKVSYGEPVILALRETAPNPTDVMLGRLSKKLIRPYRDAAVIWDHEFEGEITDVVTTPNRVALTIRMDAPLVEGDKIANSYGGKGIVGKILPDSQMPHTEDGKPIDVLVTSAGVVSRINPAQIIETAVAKAAKKTGVTEYIQNFDARDNVTWAKNKLRQANVSDKETVIDPLTGKKIPNILVGPQNFMKLFKSTDTNFAARGLGSYDTNQQPTKGGITGAKRLGKMKIDALLDHGARNVVKEAVTLKSQKNDEWWNAYKLGLPLPPIKNNFALDKFSAMLAGAGVKLQKDKNFVSLGAMTDADVAQLSSGTITNDEALRKKDLKPELGGLFDPLVTGGLEGEKWSDITFNEPILKPAFSKPVATLLGLGQTSLEKTYFEHGGNTIRKALDKIDLAKRKKDLMGDIKNLRGDKLNKVVKELKIINALLATNLKPSEAYLGKKLAVVPPIMRPVVPGPNNQLLIADANHLYRDVLVANKKIEESKQIGLPNKDIAPIRQTLFNSVKAVAGLGEPTSKKLLEQGKKGFIKQITGPRPSEGYFQEKIIGRPQDLSGRGTAGPDPTLGIDEIGMPEEMAWGVFAPFIIKKLVAQGYSALRAKELLDQRAPVAKSNLLVIAKERPVIVNRAPSLHRFSVVSAYPRLIPGKTFRVNPFMEAGTNLDYDGDALQLHVPVTPQAVEETKGMVLSNNLMGDKTRNNLLVFPQHESIVGLYGATKPNKSKTHEYKSLDAAVKDVFNNKIDYSTNVSITGK
jgi:DNA-directed RNA polymerase subunit beta